MKIETINASEQIINSLKALFDFFPEIQFISKLIDEIQKLLNLIFRKKKFPSSILKLIQIKNENEIQIKNETEIQTKNENEI